MPQEGISTTRIGTEATAGNDTGVEHRIRRVAAELSESLRPVVLETSGPAVRPSIMVRKLGIDKSLASRLARAARCDDPHEFMHVIPSPTGLRLFLEAAQKSGVATQACARANAGVENFQVLIDNTAGGRSTLDAALSQWVPAARDKSERGARHAIYKAMSYVLGYCCDTVASTLILHPSSHGSTTDAVDVYVKFGLRRLRPSMPIRLFGMRPYPPENSTSRREAIDGGSPTEPSSYMLKKFCTDPLPPIVFEHDEDYKQFVLKGTDPPLDSPLSFVAAEVHRGSYLRYQTDEMTEEFRRYLLRYPTKLLIRDVFIHDDLCVGDGPELEIKLPDTSGRIVRHDGLRGELDVIDLPLRVQSLGRGLERVGVKSAPTYGEIVSHCFNRLSWDADEFQGYRILDEYPVPLVSMTWWLPLATTPEA